MNIILNEDGVRIKDLNKIANIYYNNSFKQTPVTISQRVGGTQVDYADESQEPNSYSNQFTLFLGPVTNDEVQITLRQKIKYSKAVGPDGIPGIPPPHPHSF